MIDGDPTMCSTTSTPASETNTRASKTEQHQNLDIMASKSLLEEEEDDSELQQVILLSRNPSIEEAEREAENRSPENVPYSGFHSMKEDWESIGGNDNVCSQAGFPICQGPVCNVAEQVDFFTVRTGTYRRSLFMQQ